MKKRSSLFAITLLIGGINAAHQQASRADSLSNVWIDLSYVHSKDAGTYLQMNDSSAAGTQLKEFSVDYYEAIDGNFDLIQAENTRIDSLTGDVDINEANIVIMDNAIEDNEDNIDLNTSKIADNELDINELAKIDFELLDDIEENEDDIKDNASQIVTNTEDIDANTKAIAAASNSSATKSNKRAINTNRRAINSLQDNVNDLGFGVAGATALSTAMSALPTVAQDSPLSCGVGTGGYSSRFAMSVGCAVKASYRLSINAGGSYVFGGATDYGNGSLSSAAARAGFVFKLGKIDTPAASNEQLQSQLDEVKDENEELRARLERLEAIALGNQPAPKTVSLK